MRGGAFLAACVLLVAAHAAQAQAQRQVRDQRAPDSAARLRLEGEIRRGFARAVRQRVGLSDEQMRRLAPISQRHEQQRRRLQVEERDARQALREATSAYQPGDSTRVTQLLARLIGIQKQRIQILESEQRELATIMTPLQRARFLALQDQVRRRLEDMRQRRAGADEGARPGVGRRPILRPPR